MKSALNELDTKIGENLITGFGISGKDFHANVDADYWDPMSTQDQDTIFNGLLQVWAECYVKHHPGASPEGGSITFRDLAGNRLKWDVISAP